MMHAGRNQTVNLKSGARYPKRVAFEVTIPVLGSFSVLLEQTLEYFGEAVIVICKPSRTILRCKPAAAAVFG